MNTEFNTIVEVLRNSRGVYHNGPMGQWMKTRSIVEWVNHRGEISLSPVEEGRFYLQKLKVTPSGVVTTHEGMGGMLEWAGDSVLNLIFRARMYRQAVEEFEPGSPSRILRILTVETGEWETV